MKTKTNKSKSTFKKILAVGLSIGLLASIGIGAYLTDTDVKSDVYTVGNVQAEIVSVGDMELDNVGALLPNTVHQYERAATNTGINDAYVFMSVTIPFDYVGTAHVDGTQDNGPMTLAQIFTPYTADMAKGVNSEWKLVDDGFIGQYEIAENGYRPGTHEDYYTIVGNTITYVYGYVGDNADGSLKALGAGETTSNLVDQMAVNNFYKVANITGEISTKLYAIQSNHVNGGLTDVNGVWAVINTALVGEIEAPADPVAPLTNCPGCGASLADTIYYLPAQPATCETKGLNADIYICSDCEKIWYDENYTNEANAEDVLIPELGHNIVDGECTREGCRYSENGGGDTGTPDIPENGGGNAGKPDIDEAVYFSDASFDRYSIAQIMGDRDTAAIEVGSYSEIDAMKYGPFNYDSLATIGDKATISFEVSNESEFDAMLTFETYCDSKYFTVSIDNPELILGAGETATITVTVELIQTPTEFTQAAIQLNMTEYLED